MTIKDRVKAHLESLAEPQSPTQIGLALGISYSSASSAVNPALKALVSEGWAHRYEHPVRYEKATA